MKVYSFETIKVSELGNKTEHVLVNVEEVEKGTVHFDIDGRHLLRYLATQKDVSPFNIDGNR